MERAWEVVLRSARTDAPGTDPALVALPAPVPSWLYWDAVRSVVPVARVRAELERRRAEIRTHGSDRGLVGATAAVAWPERRPTWELISYRAPDRWGRPREVDRESVRRAARAHPALFLCDDPRTRRLLVAPHTPCPILYGLRATAATPALRARREVRSEPVDRWVLFRTNQGTGDHLVARPLDDRPALGSGRWAGWVGEPPLEMGGGHVAFSIEDQDGRALRCVAFEPTKTLPRVARTLRPSDRVRVWGSCGPDRVVRLEGLEIVRLAPGRGPIRGPRCPSCRKATRSLGHLRGYRCATCRRRWPPEAGRPRSDPIPFGPGVYHPTPSARRHLAPRGPEP